MEYTHVTHTFEPVFDTESEILILGSFPSVKSRENRFYYGHPQNRFWKVTAAVCGCDVPVGIEEKKRFLLQNKIAVWDVIASCDIIGSSDSSIRNVTGNDMNVILEKAPVRCIFTNGDKAYRLFLKYCMDQKRRETPYPEVCRLPSTSPANAAWSLERLTETWRAEIGHFLTRR
ncbi:MAG: DNA-deoxyinosine glycosylase [Lachnospiraceae bacterium]|nr:DNA-deoxyinosine glycosylase [Lachnospiraceae bacterium]